MYSSKLKREKKNADTFDHSNYLRVLDLCSISACNLFPFVYISNESLQHYIPNGLNVGGLKITRFKKRVKMKRKTQLNHSLRKGYIICISCFFLSHHNISKNNVSSQKTTEKLMIKYF